MTIEFRCSQCNQLLRVPDTSAGKNARCPKCNALMQVPSAGAFAAAAPPPPPPPTSAASIPSFGPPAPPPAKSNDPFAFLSPGGGAPAAGGPVPPPPPKSPFPEVGSPGPAVNPYASPLGTSAAGTPAIGGGPINPQRVSMDPIFNYAWQVWKVNLGLLIGVTVIIMAISMVISLVISGAQFALQQADQPEAAVGVYFLGQVISFVASTYLGIGNALIALKLARGQRAEFGDLFKVGPQFLPVLGVSLIIGVIYMVGAMLCIVPGIIALLMFWPAYWLVADQKADVIESLTLATRISQGNWGTAFILGLLAFVIMLAGCAALCVGLLAAAPLINMLGAVAYLMMSGQLPVQYGYSQR
jgi:phage FluMu protein Com